MPIKVQWGSEGPFAICDTPAEAMELMKHANIQANGNGIGSKTKGRIPLAESRDKVKDLLENLNPNAKILLKGLVGFPDGIESDQLSKVINIDSNGFGGILGGISRATAKYEVSLDDLLTSEARFEGARRFRWLQPTDLLLKHKDGL